MPVLFLDDGGVMNENQARGAQWRQLLGEFFPPRLGGTPEAWAAANLVVAERMWGNYLQTMRGRAGIDYAAYWRAEQLEWLYGMCELVGVNAPPEDQSVELAEQAAAYVTRRVRAAFPGAVEAIRVLCERGYLLHTASGERSAELDGYLEGMGVRECFGRLYGPDLVNTMKEGPAYYQRIFADAGVDPAGALVVDDNAIVAEWVVQAGARVVLVGQTAACAAATIGGLAELPALLERLELSPSS